MCREVTGGMVHQDTAMLRETVCTCIIPVRPSYCRSCLTFTSILLSPPQIVDYNGGRTLDDLTKWVEAQVEGKGDEGEEEEEEEEPEEEAGPDHTEL